MAGSDFLAHANPGIADQSATPGVLPDGSWVFRDDRGQTVSLPTQPTVIAAQTTSAATLWDFGVEPVAIFGPYRNDDGTADPQTGAIDLDRVPELGYPEMNVEQLIALSVELYIDVTRIDDQLWYGGEDAMQGVVPTLGIKAYGQSILKTVQRFEDLASALGADLQSEANRAAKTGFEASEQAFRDALAAKPDLKVVAIGGGFDDNLYWVNPGVVTDLYYYRDLGLQVTVPPSPDASTGNNFAIYSLEQFGEVAGDADLILVDSRAPHAFDDMALWQALPAVQAGQVGEWRGTFPFSYQALGSTLDYMTGLIAERGVL
jgi:iron complex transport system substrate-binding protein